MLNKYLLYCLRKQFIKKSSYAPYKYNIKQGTYKIDKQGKVLMDLLTLPLPFAIERLKEERDIFNKKKNN